MVVQKWTDADVDADVCYHSIIVSDFYVKLNQNLKFLNYTFTLVLLWTVIYVIAIFPFHGIKLGTKRVNRDEDKKGRGWGVYT